MDQHQNARRRLAALALTIGLVAACSGGQASVSQVPVASVAAAPSRAPLPHPTAVPTPAPTPRPTPAVQPTPKSAPTSQSDPAAALKIGSPYKLVANAANPALNTSIVITVGGTQVTETITGREIKNAGKLVGLALVLQIKGVPMTKAVFEAGAQTAANNAKGKLTYTTIGGQRVAIIAAPLATYAMFRLHGNIVMVAGIKATDTKPLVTSVIKANI